MRTILTFIRLSTIPVCLAAVFSYAGLLDRNPQGAVNDFASLLSVQTKSSLESLSKALLEKTGVSCVLVTVDDLEGLDINDASTKLFEKWGIGKKGIDEGVLVLVAVKDRRVRIETGYGSEGYITDAQSNRIIHEITPALSQQHWDEGCTEAMTALSSLAAAAHGTSLREITGKDLDYSPSSPIRVHKPNIFGILFFIALVLFLCTTRSGRSLLFFMLLSSLSSSSGRSSGRGFGGGFGGGGFSGFGGGMSGGGGATGRF
jgi:uncharacterized protein